MYCKIGPPDLLIVIMLTTYQAQASMMVPFLTVYSASGGQCSRFRCHSRWLGLRLYTSHKVPTMNSLSLMPCIPLVYILCVSVYVCVCVCVCLCIFDRGDHCVWMILLLCDNVSNPN